MLVPQLFFGTALSWPSQICKRTTNVVESLIEYPYARTISTGQRRKFYLIPPCHNRPGRNAKQLR